MWRNILLLFICFLAVNSLSAQKRHTGRIEITGKVQDVYNSPIANAILMVDGVTEFLKLRSTEEQRSISILVNLR